MAVLEHVQPGASSCHLIGHSMGGTIALDMRMERPELVDSLVLVNGGVSGFQAGALRPKAIVPENRTEFQKRNSEVSDHGR
jgi:pimeloyl-ACP methyl ester carboxylesterase